MSELTPDKVLVCVELDDNTLFGTKCEEWAYLSDVYTSQGFALPPLSYDDALQIGGMLLLITIIAWSIRFLARFVLNNF